MTAQPGDRSFLVFMMQGAFLLVTVAAFVPYWIYGLPSNIERVKGPLAVWWGVLVLYWIGAYIRCGVHLAVRAKFRRAAISAGDIREASYINAVAIGNAIWIFFIVAGTGGLIGSSFVPFLLITPAL